MQHIPVTSLLSCKVPDVDAVVIPVGGGGLLAGIAKALKTMKPSVKIIVSGEINFENDQFQHRFFNQGVVETGMGKFLKSQPVPSTPSPRRLRTCRSSPVPNFSFGKVPGTGPRYQSLLVNMYFHIHLENVLLT